MDTRGAAIVAVIFLAVAGIGGLFAIIRLAIISAHEAIARKQKQD